MSAEGSDLQPFTYHRAADLRNALAELRRPGACVYAGGTDLVVALRNRAPWVSGIRHLVDIKDVTEARGIVRQRETLRIGALTTARDLSSSAVVRRRTPVLARAAMLTSAPALRARGTVGGNVMTPHPAGDVATALLALDAIAEFAIAERRTQRVSVADLLTSRAAPPPGSVMVALHVPTSTASWYERLGRRHGFCRATLSVAVAYHEGGTQIAIGGLAERPVLQSTVPPASPLSSLVDTMVERAVRRALSVKATP